MNNHNLFRRDTSKSTHGKKGEQVPFLSIEYFEYDFLRSQVHQLRVQVVLASPLATEPVKPLVELSQRRSLQVGAGGVHFARGEDDESVVVAVVGIEQVMQHSSLLCSGRSQPYFDDTIIPLLDMEIKKQIVNNL